MRLNGLRSGVVMGVEVEVREVFVDPVSIDSTEVGGSFEDARLEHPFLQCLARRDQAIELFPGGGGAGLVDDLHVVHGFSTLVSP